MVALTKPTQIDVFQGKVCDLPLNAKIGGENLPKISAETRAIINACNMGAAPKNIKEMAVEILQDSSSRSSRCCKDLAAYIMRIPLSGFAGALIMQTLFNPAKKGEIPEGLGVGLVAAGAFYLAFPYLRDGVYYYLRNQKWKADVETWKTFYNRNYEPLKTAIVAKIDQIQQSPEERKACKKALKELENCYKFITTS